MNNKERGLRRRLVEFATDNRTVRVVSGATAVVGTGAGLADYVANAGIHTDKDAIIFLTSFAIGTASGYVCGGTFRRNNS